MLVWFCPTVEKIEILFTPTQAYIFNTTSIDIQTMNSATIQRIINKSESSIKMNKGKNVNGKNVNGKNVNGKNANGTKARRTEAYWNNETARQRRKQGKTRYDTFRREDQPEAADLRLEDIHFANFLGLSKCEWGNGNYTMAYNDGKYYDNFNIDSSVNISHCDLYLKEKLKQEQVQEQVQEQEQKQEQAAAQGGCVLDNTTICYCFLLGICGRGNGCKFIHVPPADIPKYKELFMEDDGIIGSEDEGWVEDDDEEEEFTMEPPDSRVRLTEESIRTLGPIAGVNSMVDYNTLKVELAKQIEDDKV